MTEILLVFLTALVAGLTVAVVRGQKGGGNSGDENAKKLFEENISLKKDLETKTTELGKLDANLQREQKEKNELAGKNKQMFVQNTNLEKDLKNAQIENQKLEKKNSDFEAQKIRIEKEHAESLKKLEHSQKSFEDEKVRVARADEERIRKKEEERNRLWSEHEISVIAKLKEICQSPEIGFSFFENTNLPDSFDGSLKPDFLIEIFPE